MNKIEEIQGIQKVIVVCLLRLVVLRISYCYKCLFFNMPLNLLRFLKC